VQRNIFQLVKYLNVFKVKINVFNAFNIFNVFKVNILKFNVFKVKISVIIMNVPRQDFADLC